MNQDNRFMLKWSLMICFEQPQQPQQQQQQNNIINKHITMIET